MTNALGTELPTNLRPQRCDAQRCTLHIMVIVVTPRSECKQQMHICFQSGRSCLEAYDHANLIMYACMNRASYIAYFNTCIMSQCKWWNALGKASEMPCVDNTDTSLCYNGGIVECAQVRVRMTNTTVIVRVRVSFQYLYWSVHMQTLGANIY